MTVSDNTTFAEGWRTFSRIWAKKPLYNKKDD